MSIKDYFSIAIPSLALCIALYTFLSNNPKFREFGARFWGVVALELVGILFCSMLLFVTEIRIDIGNEDLQDKLKIVENIFEYLFLAFFLFGWIYLFRIFYLIYGSLYHLRKKRFIKYIKPISWIYENVFHKKFYETNYRKRKQIKLNCFSGISNDIIDRIKGGGTILFLYDDNYDYMETVTNFVKETIQDKETVDYITTFRSPIELCKYISDDEISSICKKLSIIDCFSPHYGFDDKVLKFTKEDLIKKGYKFYEAGSFSEIHSAANSSWYRFRELCQNEENEYRIPHRTIYDTLSSLIRFSSEEQYFLFIRHVIYSEQSYGMISFILEPNSIKTDIRNELIQMSNVVFTIEQNSIKVLK